MPFPKTLVQRETAYSSIWTRVTASILLPLIKQPIYEMETSEFKPALSRLKIDLVSHPGHFGGVG